ncbi:zinc finger MYM-type protein 1-like [Pseudophryne corroboree]|uniref:zinc finger MYM-type protein 1-like n=1 Tax=Pseudophryne corroboree TaxID=495146 RepID=UPI0030817FA7
MKKQQSGWDKLKAKKEEKKNLEKVLAKTKKITDFCSIKSAASSSVVSPSASTARDFAVGASEAGASEAGPSASADHADTLDVQNITSESVEGDTEIVVEQTKITFSNDVGEWKVSETLREFFCQKGVADCHFLNSDFTNTKKIFPGEHFARHCTKSLFYREQINGEKVQRDWLCYSPKTLKLFCAHCKLFSSDATLLLATDGYSDWRHAARDLSRHESSATHADSLEKLIRRKLTGERIDKSLVIQYESEKKYWHQILRRILSTIKLLSSRGLAFRGNDEIIGSVHNGNYLGCLEFLAEYDPFLAEHIQMHANKGRGHVSYLSSTICDEFIEVIGQQVLRQIITEIKTSKYYSVSVDSTPDISHTDQLTLIFRYVLPNGPIERFTKFIPVRGHTGEHLANTLLLFLEENGISIQDCRGQSYDNASNMSGKYNGMQAMICQKNVLAEYIPCYGHSLNLIGQSAVKCCSEAVLFFDFVQKLYVSFSTSTHRWNLLTDVFKPLGLPTLKSLSNTRWSAHHDALNSLKKGYPAIKDLLHNMANDTSEREETCLEAKGLCTIMGQLENGIMVQLWSTILSRFNKTSHFLQDSRLDLNRATDILEALKMFVESLRSQFPELENQSKILYSCDDYKQTRQIKRNKKWDFGGAEDAAAGLSPSDKFKVNTFLPIIDQLVSSLNRRKEAYSVIRDRFGFLSELCSLPSDDLRAKASALVGIYPGDLGREYADEVVHFAALFRIYISSGTNTDTHESQEIKMYKFLITEALVGNFPNVGISLRMYLCLMVTNCSGERSFSALKRVKNALRSSMAQQRLNALSLLCIENELLREMDMETVIEEFSSRKARKVNV